MNKPQMFRIAAATLLAGASMASLAGGFMLTEQSVAGLGRAYAGAGIVGDDVSAVWYNAAGMTLLKGTQVSVAATGAFLDFDYGDENGRKKGVQIPSAFISHELENGVRLGFGIVAPYGLATHYSRNWQMNQRGMDAKVTCIDMNPNIAVPLPYGFSVGGGFSLQYAKATIESAAGSKGMYKNLSGSYSADGFAWGVNLGAMWEPSEQVRVGLAYRSQVKHHTSGTYEVRMNVSNRKVATLDKSNGWLKLDVPHTVMLTGLYKATDRMRFMGTVRWSDWSCFESLPIRTSSKYGGKTINNKWKDCWLFTVGAEYDFTPSWTGRVGLGYESSVIDDESYRTALIPDGARLWLSTGATWRVNKNWQVDAGVTFLKGLGSIKLYEQEGNKSSPHGSYDTLNALLAGIQAVYRF